APGVVGAADEIGNRVGVEARIVVPASLRERPSEEFLFLLAIDPSQELERGAGEDVDRARRGVGEIVGRLAGREGADSVAVDVAERCNTGAEEGAVRRSECASDRVPGLPR